MEKTAYLACLLDFYGPLLTDRQRELMALRADEDLSLSEIAQSLRVSRQAVSDGLKSAEAHLVRLEEQLGLFARYEKLDDAVQRALDALRQNNSRLALEILLSLKQEENYGI